MIQFAETFRDSESKSNGLLALKTADCSLAARERRDMMNFLERRPSVSKRTNSVKKTRFDLTARGPSSYGKISNDGAQLALAVANVITLNFIQAPEVLK
jgi:hypothetical protein